VGVWCEGECEEASERGSVHKLLHVTNTRVRSKEKMGRFESCSVHKQGVVRPQW
jgi:hypothetical protein